MKQTILAGAVAAVLACSVSGCGSLQPAATPAMQFNYATTDSAATGLVRAFDMNGNTVLQFVDLALAKPSIYEPGKADPLPFGVIGQYAVLQGIHPALRVRTAGGDAAVRRADPAPAPAGQAAAPDALATTRAELAQAQTELAAVKRELAALQANPSATAQAVQTAAAGIDNIEQRLASTANAIVRVNFDFASTVFEPTPGASANLLAGAKMATRINVRGHTDSATADQANYAVALGRALATRQYLVKHGVDGRKIKLFAYPAGRFVAENKTAEGRRQNRRVEVELMGQTAPIVAASGAN